jgi:ATP-dependent helicase/nuclease subunit B
MLHLLLGRAGSGKTFSIRERLHSMAKGGQTQLFLLVPEQASFDNERALLKLLGPKDAQRVQVLSFSRLCDALARSYGGGAGRRLTDGGRVILMSQALEQIKDTLQFYRRSAQGTELIQMLLDANAEFKSCGISPRDLHNAAIQSDKSVLRQKLEELSQILDCYEALVAQSWVDPQDDLTRAAACLEKHSFFQGADVFIDEFQSFTKQQYGVLRFVMRQAQEVTVSLCTDTLEDSEHGMGLFSIVRQTAYSFIRLANEENVPVASPEKLPAGIRYYFDDLRELEAYFYRTENIQSAVTAKHVTLYEAANPYEEASFVASAIRHLLMKGQCRARDIAVVARDMDSYRDILDTALDTYEIPYFMDEARDITHEPLMRFVLAAFAAVRTGYDSETIFTYLKTNLTGITPDVTAALENYCFTWQISGKTWHQPFTLNPDGFTGSFTPDEQKRLEGLEKARRQIINPLEAFAKVTLHTDGVSIAKAVYQLLQDAEVPKHLKELAAALEQAGSPSLADDTLRLWDVLMQVLDQCALVLGEQPIARSRFEELLRMVISDSQISSIPQGLDQVTVGAADRIRIESPKVVFLLDAAKEDFPKAPGTAGVFSFAERLSLIDGGLPLNDTMAGVDVQERFLAYAAVSAPSCHLYLSWPTVDTGGNTKLPSSIVTETQRILKNVSVQTAFTLPTAFFSSSRKAAFSQLARSWGQKADEQEATLQALFSQEQDAPQLAAVRRAAEHTPLCFAEQSRAKELFHADMRISASQAETYAKCPFQYFCQYGLQAKERRTAELDPMEYGSLMHDLLERLFSSFCAQELKDMQEEKLNQLILSFIYDYVNEKMGIHAENIPRFQHLLFRAAQAAFVIARHVAEELCQSEFVPSDFELPIGPQGVPGIHLALPDGGSVELIGKVDRVDTWEEEGHTWIRVIDYKTGQKRFALSDVLYGIDMQMLLYLAALCKNGKEKYKNPIPAGVLYMPASVSAVLVERTEEHKRDKQQKQLCMNGLICSDTKVIKAMEQGAGGKYIPVKQNKNGDYRKTDAMVTEKELNSILRYTEKQLQEMGRQLHSGNVQAMPLEDACQWCPYTSVCGHEENGPVREETVQKQNEILQQIHKEEGEKDR